MPLWLAVVLLASAVIGIVLCRKYLRRNKTARILGIVLAIALVACPIESTRNITAGIGFILGAVSVAWLGVRQRKGARQEYEDTVRRYTGTTMMKVVWIEESVNERWEQQEDGSEQLRRETVYTARTNSRIKD